MFEISAVFGGERRKIWIIKGGQLAQRASVSAQAKGDPLDIIFKKWQREM